MAAVYVLLSKVQLVNLSLYITTLLVQVSRTELNLGQLEGGWSVAE